MSKKGLRDIDVRGKRVLVRVDLNVPMGRETGAISDDTRLKAVLPTIRYLVEQGARVVLCSHLGRPGGKVVESMRMAPVAQALSALLGREVATATDCIGPEVEAAAAALNDGDVLLLENLRFHPEEERNDPEFARALARLGEVYIDDAFGTAHRAHASTVGVAQYLPAVAGLLLERELDALGGALESPARPLAALIGGAKISDKIGVLEHILARVDSLLIGGGMVSTFARALGHTVGSSAVEEDKIELAQDLMERARKRDVRLLLPEDVCVADGFHPEAASRVVPLSDIPDGWLIMDIGPKTIARFEEELITCRTVIWNGPMGVFEYPKFQEGTYAMARLLAGLDAATIIGGGSTAEAVAELGLADRMTHVSTGGGASLEFLEGKTLPGIAVLAEREG
ncbi:MAG: phosphoglycerate kinase [Chloroflexota bacterium]|nr:phosphoglycerate kinase [Chloroflexota bacterium]